MRIVTLVENTSCLPDFECEHGLSLYIEAADCRLLFDSGRDSGMFADNAEKLGVDLSKVDYTILSHGHLDHGGGLPKFLAINDHAPVYIAKDAFGLYYNAKGRYIGLDDNLSKSDRIVYVDGDCSITDSIKLYSRPQKPLKYAINTYGLAVEKNGQRIPDDFRHEQYLLINENNRRILFSGCSHRGILNIMDWLRPDVLIGGFHFMDIVLDDNGRKALSNAAAELLDYDCVYYTGHCTGLEQYGILKSIMGDRINSISTGMELMI